MSFPRYERYKESGVEWLGEVPEGWEVKRLKFLCNVQTGDKDTVNAIEDGDYPFFVRSQTVERINSYTFNCEAVLTAGDGVGVGKVFHHYEGKFDFHQRVYMMYNFRFVTGKFFFSYLAAMFHKVALEGGAKSTVDSLRMPLFMNFEVTVPPLPEQQTIAAFLDRETGKIDELVAEQERLIALLKEKRQAVISHAVTKGLNPDAPMKDSGVEWLGAVPVGWKVGGLKRFCTLVTDGAHISPETENGVYCFVSTKDIDDDSIDFDNCLRTSEVSFEYMVKTGCRPLVGDVLFSKDGTIGRTVVVRQDSDFVVASSLIIIRPDTSVLNPEYLNYLCLSNVVVYQVESFVKGAGLPRLSIQNLLKVIGVFPPPEEQSAIVSFLNSETARIDTLTGEAQQAISLLKERRSALISAAVTGKIDVRNHTPLTTGEA
jgi:type I restriction enzyme, S subunit